MLVRRFLDRLAKGLPAERAEIVEALVRVYLDAPLDAENRAAAITAMTLILDDPAPRVRRAMADGLADAAEAPRAIMLALAEDQADIAEIVLSRSPVLADGDLIDLAGAAGERERAAIAQRPVVSVGLSAALVEVSGPDACRALIANPGAEITVSTFRRLVERHRTQAELRNALLERNDLPLTLRDELIEGLSEALGELVLTRQWLSPERADRLFRETRERSVVELAAATEATRMRPLIVRLAAEGRLTPTLLIRAACAGNFRFFEEALAVLSATPTWRVAALIHDRHSSGIAALYRRTKLPRAAEAAIRAAIATMRDWRHCVRDSGDAQAAHSIAEAVLARYPRPGEEQADEYLAMLSRLAMESRRVAARAQTGGYFRAA